MEDAVKYTGSAMITANYPDQQTKTDLGTYLEAQSVRASNLVQSVLAYDLLMQAVVLKDLTDELGGARLDVTDLIVQAALVCPDILAEYKWDESYKSIDVMRRILYNIGPDTRSVKKGKDSDKQYRLHCHADANAATITMLKGFDFSSIAYPNATAAEAKTINDAIIAKFGAKFDGVKKGNASFFTGMFVISTFKNGRAPTKAPATEEGVLLLTMKQATIIGLYLLSKFTKLAKSHNIDIFTPLSGAIFPRNSIEDMMQVKEIADTFVTGDKLIDAINKSSQNGGQFLPNSRADIAAICAVVGTAGITKEAERKNICQRTVKQYLNQDRASSKGVFTALCKFATGGIPAAWTYEQIHADYERIRLTALSRAADGATIHAASG